MNRPFTLFFYSAQELSDVMQFTEEETAALALAQAEARATPERDLLLYPGHHDVKPSGTPLMAIPAVSK